MELFLFVDLGNFGQTVECILFASVFFLYVILCALTFDLISLLVLSNKLIEGDVMRKTWLLGSLFLLGALPLGAQVDTGTITGSVRDSQNAGVASAIVTFVDLANGGTAQTKTDGSGDYASPPLRP